MKKSREKVLADKWLEKEISKLNKELGLSWTYSKDQFDAYVKEQRESGYTGEFVTIPELMNAICRKDTANSWAERYDKLYAEYKFKLNNCITMDEYIEEQMSDYECYYTGDYMNEEMVKSVMAIFPEATEKDVERVYNKTKNNH